MDFDLMRKRLIETREFNGYNRKQFAEILKMPYRAVKEKRHPALWPGAFSYARRVYPSGLSCCASGAGASGWPSSCGSGSIMSSMLQPRAWATL